MVCTDNPTCSIAETGICGDARRDFRGSGAASGEVRKNLASLPEQFSTRLPACLRFVARVRGGSKFRDRRSEALFARELGAMIDSTHRKLTDEDIAPPPASPGTARKEQATAPTFQVPARARCRERRASTTAYRPPAAAPARRRQRKAANRSGTGG